MPTLRNPVRRESSLGTTGSGTGKSLRTTRNYTLANATLGKDIPLCSHSPNVDQEKWRLRDREGDREGSVDLERERERGITRDKESERERVMDPCNETFASPLQ